MKIKDNVAFLFSICKPFKLHIAVIILANFVLALGMIFRAYAFKLIVDKIYLHEMDSLFWPVFNYFAMWFVIEFFYKFRNYALMYFKPDVKNHAVKIISKKMIHYDDFYFQKNSPSQLNNAIQNICEGLDEWIFICEELIMHAFIILTSVVSFYFINVYFGYVVFVWIIIWSLFIYFWSLNGYLLSVKMYSAGNVLAEIFGDVFANINVIKGFNNEKHELAIVEDQSNAIAKIGFQREKLFFIVWLIQSVLFFFAIAFTFVFLLSEFKMGNITVGDCCMCLELLQTLYFFVNDLAMNIADCSEITSQIIQGIDVLNFNNQLNDPYKADQTSENALVVRDFDIVLDNLKYRYPNFPNYALNLEGNIVIKSGQTVAIVGPSGSGKTTLTKLLLRLIEPTDGAIFVDNKDIAHCSIESVREIFAFIPQELGLFKRSIKDNIAYGLNVSDEEIVAAAKNAKIDEFIQSLDKKYDTILGKEISLSGGQKQRMMIARALLRKSKILLLDEITSSLDSQNESDILNNIKKSTKTMTKIIIAHRLKTVQNVNCIFVLDKGKCVEHGTHEELMLNQGLYYDLVNSF